MSLSSKSSCSEASDLSDILDCEKQRIVYKQREALRALNEDGVKMPLCDEVLEKRSRASIGISQISIPLAWKLDQHFKQKGENRTYSMFLTLQTKSNVVDSKTVTNISALDTDVTFPDSFVFHNEPDDFCVEISLYAARTDSNQDGGGSLRQRISRSFGKKFGMQAKNQLRDVRKQQIPEVVGNTYFNLIARCLLVLTDANEECQIHDLKVSAFAELAGPPLYGHLLCRLVCAPASVVRPLAEGILTIRPTHSDSVFQHVRCRLQAGVLRCYVNNDLQMNPSSEQTLHRILITPGSRVVPCSFEDSLFLWTEASMEAPPLQYLLTTDSAKAARAWTSAIEHQINDTAVWGACAYLQTKLTIEKPRELIDGTLGRSEMSRLYDSISIGGSLGHSWAGSYGKYGGSRPKLSLPPTNDGVQTAPVRRNRGRMNVRDIFSNIPEAPEVPHEEPNRNSCYVINLTVGDSPPLAKVSSSSTSCHSGSVLYRSPPDRFRHRETPKSPSVTRPTSMIVKSPSSSTNWMRNYPSQLHSPTVQITRL